MNNLVRQVHDSLTSKDLSQVCFSMPVRGHQGVAFAAGTNPSLSGRNEQRGQNNTLRPAG